MLPGRRSHNLKFRALTWFLGIVLICSLQSQFIHVVLHPDEFHPSVKAISTEHNTDTFLHTASADRCHFQDLTIHGDPFVYGLEVFNFFYPEMAQYHVPELSLQSGGNALIPSRAPPIS